jgi:hypothetical protein
MSVEIMIVCDGCGLKVPSPLKPAPSSSPIPGAIELCPKPFVGAAIRETPFLLHACSRSCQAIVEMKKSVRMGNRLG